MNATSSRDAVGADWGRRPGVASGWRNRAALFQARAAPRGHLSARRGQTDDPEPFQPDRGGLRSAAASCGHHRRQEPAASTERAYPSPGSQTSVPPFVFVCVRGVLAPRRLASPQSLSCAIQHVYSLDFTTTQAVAASLFSPALVQCKANSGGRSRIQRAVLAESIRCLFSLIDNGGSHGLNGGALPNAPNVDGSSSTHVC